MYLQKRATGNTELSVHEIIIVFFQAYRFHHFTWRHEEVMVPSEISPGCFFKLSLSRLTKIPVIAPCWVPIALQSGLA